MHRGFRSHAFHADCFNDRIRALAFGEGQDPFVHTTVLIIDDFRAKLARKVHPLLHCVNGDDALSAQDEPRHD